MKEEQKMEKGREKERENGVDGAAPASQGMRGEFFSLFSKGRGEKERESLSFMFLSVRRVSIFSDPSPI